MVVVTVVVVAAVVVVVVFATGREELDLYGKFLLAMVTSVINQQIKLVEDLEIEIEIIF